MLYIRGLQHIDADFFFGAIIPEIIKPLHTHTSANTNTNTNPNAIIMTNPPVIVVGSGLAGLAAAYEALKAGAKVHMLDRAPKPGGNSIKASSGINGAGTRFQKEKGILDDGSERFYEDSERSAGRRFQEKSGSGLGAKERKMLVETLTGQSAEAVEWLADEIGVDLTTVAMLGGHAVARTHRGTKGPPPGAAIVSALVKKLLENDAFELTNETNVEGLLVDEKTGKVNGVRYKKIGPGETHEALGPVVFAAGGFAGDATGLLAKYRPDLAGFPSTNEARPAPHPILKPVGAEFVDMDAVQVHPTGFVDPKDPEAAYKFLAAEALRGEGGILLDGVSGQRFVNELEKRDVVSDAVFKSCAASVLGNGLRQWDVTLLLDPGAAEAAASHLGFYVFKGLMRKVKIRELSPAVREAVDKYAAAVQAGRDEEFGRTGFGNWRLPPGEANRELEVAVGRVTPVTHFTMGGVAVDARARVLKKGLLVPVDGLWAAGEITGGIHGDNRLGGVVVA